MRFVALVVSALSLAAVSTASAARPPSLPERTAITRALPQALRNVPTECVWLDIRVSKSATFATVQPLFLVVGTEGNRCLKFAGDGRYVLRRHGAKWRVVFLGSDPPPCRLRVAKDLGPCTA